MHIHEQPMEESSWMKSFFIRIVWKFGNDTRVDPNDQWYFREYDNERRKKRDNTFRNRDASCT